MNDISDLNEDNTDETADDEARERREFLNMVFSAALRGHHFG